jgi:hypothetical protein
MAEYDRRVTDAGGNIAVAARRLLDEVDGQTHLEPRRVSVINTAEACEEKMGAKILHDEKNLSNDSD